MKEIDRERVCAWVCNISSIYIVQIWVQAPTLHLWQEASLACNLLGERDDKEEDHCLTHQPSNKHRSNVMPAKIASEGGKIIMMEIESGSEDEYYAVDRNPTARHRNCTNTQQDHLTEVQVLVARTKGVGKGDIGAKTVLSTSCPEPGFCAPLPEADKVTHLEAGSTKHWHPTLSHGLLASSPSEPRPLEVLNQMRDRGKDGWDREKLSSFVMGAESNIVLVDRKDTHGGGGGQKISTPRSLKVRSFERPRTPHLSDRGHLDEEKAMAAEFDLVFVGRKGGDGGDRSQNIVHISTPQLLGEKMVMAAGASHSSDRGYLDEEMAEESNLVLVDRKGGRGGGDTQKIVHRSLDEEMTMAAAAVAAVDEVLENVRIANFVTARQKVRDKYMQDRDFRSSKEKYNRNHGQGNIMTVGRHARIRTCSYTHTRTYINGKDTQTEILQRGVKPQS